MFWKLLIVLSILPGNLIAASSWKAKLEFVARGHSTGTAIRKAKNVVGMQGDYLANLCKDAQGAATTKLNSVWPEFDCRDQGVFGWDCEVSGETVCRQSDTNEGHPWQTSVVGNACNGGGQSAETNALNDVRSKTFSLENRCKRQGNIPDTIYYEPFCFELPNLFCSARCFYGAIVTCD